MTAVQSNNALSEPAIQFSISINSFTLFGFSLGKNRGWFRVFGVGLSFKNTNVHPLLFSERNGYRKGLQLGAYRFSILK